MKKYRLKKQNIIFINFCRDLRDLHMSGASVVTIAKELFKKYKIKPII